MSFKEIFESKHLNKLLIVLTTIVILVFVFSVGVFIGHEKCRFSRNWGENYYRNIMGAGGFGGPGMMDFNRPDFNARGGLGQIIKIDGNNLVIKDKASVEKTILITDKTIITKNNQNIKIADLEIDDKIVLIGRPNNQGQIEPKLIRVLPELAPTQQN